MSDVPTTMTYVGFIGSLPQLTQDNPESWKLFEEMLPYYFEANRIYSTSHKKAVLCCSGGEFLFKIIKTVCKPNTIDYVSYEELLKKLNSFFVPMECKQVKRLVFRSRKQQPEESFQTFLGNLRDLCRGCEFADEEEEIVDQLLLGLADQSFVERLITSSEGSLTLDEVMRKVELQEITKVAISKCSVDSTETTTDRVKAPIYNNKHYIQLCFRCDDDHDPRMCKFVNAICNYCSRRGHIEVACRSKKFYMNNQRY